MCSINLANKFNLKKNIILNLNKIHLLIVACTSPLAGTPELRGGGGAEEAAAPVAL